MSINSHEDDSSKLDTSCLRAAEARLIEQELLVMKDSKTIVILWGFAKFYDIIQYDVLQHGCDHNKYDRSKTAVMMMTHAAPRGCSKWETSWTGSYRPLEAAL